MAAICTVDGVARNRSVVARIVAVGLLAAAVLVAVPVVLFGPPTWVPQALVPSFLDRSMGPTVALVPADGWSEVGPTAATEAPIEVRDSGVALLAQPNDEDPWARVAYLTVTDHPTVVVDDSAAPVEGIFPTAVGEVTGLIGTDDFSGHRWATAGKSGRHLTVWAGFDVTHETLANLGAAIDTSRPLDAQKLPDGWHVATTAEDELGDGTERMLSQQVTAPEGFVQITTRTDVGPAAMWLVGSSTVSDRIEVRGRSGLITGLDSEGPVTLTWTEEPGITVQLTYASDHGDNMIEALRLANDLRPVDTEAWSRFLDEADQQQVVERVDPDDAPPPPVLVLGGQLDDGRRFRIEERQSNRLCVVVDGPHPLDRCDIRAGSGRSGANSALPRLVDPGDLALEERSPLLVYGYLLDRERQDEGGQIQELLSEGMPDGEAVAVHVADVRGRSYGTATIVGGAWAMHIPEVTLGLVVTYTFADGTSVEVEPDPGQEPDGEG